MNIWLLIAVGIFGVCLSVWLVTLVAVRREARYEYGTASWIVAAVVVFSKPVEAFSLALVHVFGLQDYVRGERDIPTEDQ
jgi:hypothetical protein